MPEAFIKYVLASLDGARSRVRCQDGLTEPFAILSSVRQGDPLAALVFIFVMDGLHTGLQSSPLGISTIGYKMAHGPTVCSLGYSDDTATMASSWDSAVGMHEWVREFLVAHHLRLNEDKSHSRQRRGYTHTHAGTRSQGVLMGDRCPEFLST